MVVLFGLLLIGLLSVAAMSIDMSRIWTMRNELQTAADAGALAGAIQLTPPHADGLATDSARVFARANKSLSDTVHVDSAVTGVWDDAAGTFAAGASPANAVHVVVSHGTNKMMMGILGIAAPRVKARATAWANAPVTASDCVKPWAIPYVVLMSKINTARGITPANSNANLTRAWDPINDVAALNAMSETDRTFNLKQGSNNGKIDDDAPGGSMPGNYHAVVLPRKWSNGVSNPDGTPSNGADRYRDNIQGPNCFKLAIGDSLDTEPGNKVGPTIQGVTADPGVCSTLIGFDTPTATSDPSYGNCLDASGNNVTVKAGFYVCRTKCTGRTTVAVEMLGSFTIKKIYPDKSKNRDPVTFEKSEIVGVFQPISATGPVGPGPTTLTRLILVR